MGILTKLIPRKEKSGRIQATSDTSFLLFKKNCIFSKFINGVKPVDSSERNCWGLMSGEVKWCCCGEEEGSKGPMIHECSVNVQQAYEIVLANLGLHDFVSFRSVHAGCCCMIKRHQHIIDITDRIHFVIYDLPGFVSSAPPFSLSLSLSLSLIGKFILQIY